eukprot:TRINITY_DN48521_c0_g1_i1.p1 TRINITY_DN48521_c0_g1~~TRINITY_DN48521_c0_g1_i1.p1  ORF type:complete len:307 (-),score=44.35 TRINITY_DN48521_c0_g1_i1:339-1259(-)
MVANVARTKISIARYLKPRNEVSSSTERRVRFEDASSPSRSNALCTETAQWFENRLQAVDDRFQELIMATNWKLGQMEEQIQLTIKRFAMLVEAATCSTDEEANQLRERVALIENSLQVPRLSPVEYNVMKAFYDAGCAASAASAASEPPPNRFDQNNAINPEETSVRAISETSSDFWVQTRTHFSDEAQEQIDGSLLYERSSRDHGTDCDDSVDPHRSLLLPASCFSGPASKSPSAGPTIKRPHSLGRTLRYGSDGYSDVSEESFEGVGRGCGYEQAVRTNLQGVARSGDGAWMFPEDSKDLCSV